METLQFTEIESKIIEKLDSICKEWHDGIIVGDYNWTRRIKEYLGNLGNELDYEVCGSGFPDCFHGEWLYDLVWYKENNERLLISVPLVVESEWGRSYYHIKYDFEKLLLANADHRLMICQSGKYKIEEIMEYFRKAVRAYPALKTGERFLIAFLDDYDTGEFIFESIIKE